MDNIDKILKDVKRLQKTLETYSKTCEQQIENLEDGEMKTFLDKSLKQALSGNLDIDTFLKNINKCQK
jgi:hypothetical protein